MFIRLSRGMYWAVHFAGGAHGAHEISIETDEHRRQKDYWHRAAEDAGYRASKEFPTGGRTILDVAIDGLAEPASKYSSRCRARAAMHPKLACRGSPAP
jgi:hypothetical protein